MKKIPPWSPTDITRQLTKSSIHDDVAPGTCAPLVSMTVRRQMKRYLYRRHSVPSVRKEQNFIYALD